MNSFVVDIAIGLLFVFVLMSMLCSSIQEIYAGGKNVRGKMLKKGIEAMLSQHGEPGTATTTEQEIQSRALVHGVMNHALVRGMSSGQQRWPSYVSSNTFAIVLADVLAEQYKAGAHLYDDFPRTVAAMPDGQLTRRLKLLVRLGRGDGDQIKAQIEQWYDETMARVGGWYKRSAQVSLFAIGFFVAALLNVDTLFISERLVVDPALRVAVVAQAQAFTGSDSSEMRESVETPIEKVDSPPEEQTDPKATGVASQDKQRDAQAELKKDFSRLAALGIPIGYPDGWWAERMSGYKEGDWLAPVGNLVLGWLLTALAVSLGAPFWFDLLSKLMPMRASGQKPQEDAANKSGETPPRSEPVPVVLPTGEAISAQGTWGNFEAGWASRVSTVDSCSQSLNAYEYEEMSLKDVVAIQRALSIPTTGYLDQATRLAITEFQTATGFEADGQLSSRMVEHLLADPAETD